MHERRVARMGTDDILKHAHRSLSHELARSQRLGILKGSRRRKKGHQRRERSYLVPIEMVMLAEGRQ